MQFFSLLSDNVIILGDNEEYFSLKQFIPLHKL